jgi:transcriptional regulator with XRE-family HTH domain
MNNRKKYNYDNELFGQRVQQFREDSGLSKSELCRRIGIYLGKKVHPATITHIEKVEVRVSPQMRRVIVEVLIEAVKTKATLPYSTEDFIEFHRLSNETAPEQPQKSSSSIDLSAHLLKYQKFSLEYIEKTAAKLQENLYREDTDKKRILDKATELYERLKDARFPKRDVYATRIQMQVALIRGRAEDAFYPWYKRPFYVIRTFEEAQNRFLSPYEERHLPDALQHLRTQLFALWAPYLREIGDFPGSRGLYEGAAEAAKKYGDLRLQVLNLRGLAHAHLVAGNMKPWNMTYEKARSVSKPSPALESMVETGRASGQRRLAYSLDPGISAHQREVYAVQAIETLERARKLCPNLWDVMKPADPEKAPAPDAMGFVTIDAHSLMIELIRAQSLVWIDVDEALNVLTALREQAVKALPALVVKINYAIQCAKALKAARGRYDPVPVFDIDEMYRKNRRGQ